jgi:hypothetical protein
MNTNNHNFIIGPSDTDSISFCKPDMSEMTQHELDSLLFEINKISPEYIIWEDDGYYQSCVALKAKNYVLFNGKKKLIKGSAFKTSSKETALKYFMEELVDEMLNNNNLNTLIDIYHKYVKESQNIKDISRWVTKKTITHNVYHSERTNETKIVDAIKGETLFEGDKIWLFSVIDGEKHKKTKGQIEFYKDGAPKMVPNTALKLQKHWVPGIEDKGHYLKRVYNTIKIFKNVIPIEQFINFSLSKNSSLLLEILK